MLRINPARGEESGDKPRFLPEPVAFLRAKQHNRSDSIGLEWQDKEKTVRAVVQRVSQAKVTVEGRTSGEIGKGFLVLISSGRKDTDTDVAWMASKLLALRVFPDDEGKMNRSILEAGGDFLVVSQFTLHGDCRKGARPSFSLAMAPEEAKRLVDLLMEKLCHGGASRVESGIFGAMMKVALVNDGPVTLLLDSEKNF